MNYPDHFIYTFNIDTTICDDLINYHKNNYEYKHNGVTGSGENKDIKESVDVEFFNNSREKICQDFFYVLNEAYKEYCKKYDLNTAAMRTEMANIIQYYPPGGGFKKYHFERFAGDVRDRQLVYMVYLNDVPNAGTHWKYQDIKTEAKKGLGVIWPSDFTHTHKGIISHEHEKWIVTGWFRFQ